MVRKLLFIEVKENKKVNDLIKSRIKTPGSTA
jgi:hypothetical protein